MSVILAIDPGTTHSGWCEYDIERGVTDYGFDSNDKMLATVQEMWTCDQMALEMVASYGMPVGREVFETVLWSGRFVQAWREPGAVQLVYRKDVKSYLCGSMKAKDANIRQALLDLLGPVGTKKAPGPLYGVSGHVWPALAVAVTVAKVKRPIGAVAGLQEAA